MTLTSTTAAHLVQLAVCCSPLRARPAAPEAARRWHAPADRFLIATRPWVIPAAVLLAVVAGQIANMVPSRYAMLPAVAYYVAIGSWCGANFVRCREAHCLITGAGFAVLSIAALAAVGLDRNWFNMLSLMIVPLLVAGFTFEAVWTSRRGSNAIRSVNDT